MEIYYLIGGLLLLIVGRSGSVELLEETTASEESTQSLETLAVTSKNSPSIKHLEAETLATSAAPDVTSVHVGKVDALPNSVASTATAMADPEVTEGSLTTAITPMESSSVAPTAATTEDMGVMNISLQTVIWLGDHTTPEDSPDEDDESEADPKTTDSSTTQHQTRGGKEYGTPDITDTEFDRDDGRVPSRDSSSTEGPDQKTGKDGKDHGKSLEQKDKDMKRLILIGVIIFILILLLAVMLFFLLRKKRRSGSFRTHSKKHAKQDVWAGQVPELGDGKAAQEPALVENGTAGTALEAVKEEEMITFVSGEKKEDSMVEMNELGSGEKAEANGGEKLGKEATEEKTPLLEDAPEESPKGDDTAEQAPVPPVEQELMANGI